MSDACQQAPLGFAQFDLHPSIMKGIDNAGFEEPRPIQAKTLPAALEGRDILGLAQTGTGKTAGFALPILERIMRDPGPGPRALILAPTRELAAQITAEIRTLAKGTRIKAISIYGGVGQGPQVTGLRSRPEVLVACPGRLLDLVQQGHAKLGNIETLVLDEADHMFDMGFLVDIRKILKCLPRDRQNLLFSATMPSAIRRLADEMLHKPHVVELAHKKPIDLIEQVIYPVHQRKKIKLLEHLLESDSMTRAIVFARTKRGAKTLAQKLERSGYCAVALQGNMSQNQREKVMRGFRAGNYEVLVATDIAARGIDVAGVSHVINYDAPSTAEAYTHRIGRTGRAECSGKACTFITSEDRALVRAIERHINQKLPQEVLEEFTQHEGEDMRDVAPRSTKKAGSRRSGRPGGRPGAEGGSRPPARRRRSKGGKSSGSNAAPHRTRSSSRSAGAGQSRDSR